MNKTPRKAQGVSDHGSDHEAPTTRALICATPVMALRLESIKRGAWWAR